MLKEYSEDSSNISAAFQICSYFQKCLKVHAKLIKWTLIALFFVSHLSTARIILGEERVCNTTEIIGSQKEHMLYKLLNCDVIEGSLIIANVNFSSVMLKEPFPLREITEYLFIYRVDHLQSLETIFPNLTVIRGEALFGNYALIIHENLDLQNIGLISLVNILHGSVRITKNPKLCYVHTINWFHILSDMDIQHFVLRNNRNQNHCPLCDYNDHKFKVQFRISNSSNSRRRIHCWDHKKPQKICGRDCAKGSCNSKGECCNELCLFDCPNSSISMCPVCKYYKHHEHGCVKSCDDNSYKLSNRRCVSTLTCEKLGLTPHSRICSIKCPPGWMQKNKTCEKCQTACIPKTCHGGQIRSSTEARKYLYCTHIEGSLDVQLVEKGTNIIEELERGLSSITEITGYLRVRNSPHIISLSFFKNLKIIRGQELIENEYALQVSENYHLENIWSHNQTVKIENGRISFHFNPKLCYEKISNIIMTSMKTEKNRELLINDISPYSNGDAVVCGPNLTNLTTTVEKVNSTAVRIKVTPLVFEDKRIFLGYLYYYTEAPEQNVTIFDSRHGCGHDRWKLDVDLSKNVRHIITNLKPYTQYGFFVKTFTVTNAHLQKDAYSQVTYFETLPWKPGPISKFYADAQGDTDIVLHWWPPATPNGPIAYYLINIVKIMPKEQHREMEIRNLVVGDETNEPEYDNVEVEIHNRKILDTKLNITLSCKCLDSDYWRGYAPMHQDNYDETEVIFEDAVVDHVYIPADISEIRNANKTDSLPKISKEKQELFNRRLEEEEHKALMEHDTGIDDFIILLPGRQCHLNDCLRNEVDAGDKSMHLSISSNTTILSGNIHSHCIQGLEPLSKYQLTIRACVEGGLSMCGPGTFLNVTTWSASIFPQ